MLIRFFKNNNPSLFVLLPIFALVLWIISFINQPQFTETKTAFLYNIVSKPLNAVPYLNTIFAFLLIIGEAFLINFIANENEVITRRTFLPALLYIVFMSNNEAMLTVNPSMFANLFILFSLNKLFTSFRKNTAFSNAFDAGFYLSIASFFYFPSIILFPILIVGLLIFRTFNWREWSISFIGIITPYCFVLTYYLWANQLKTFWNNITSYFVLHDTPSFNFSSSFYFMEIVMAIIILLSLGTIVRNIRSASQKTKKNLIFLNWFFFFSIISFSIAPQLSSPCFSILAIPLSIFTANYFLNMKKELLGELLFLLFIATILINDFSKYF